MILLGNAISLAASLVMVAIGLIKTKKNIVLAQCGQFALHSAANFVLGGYMGMVTNLISIARNLICLKWEFDLKFKLLFSVLQIGLAAFTNSERIIGWLPAASALVLTWFLDCRDEIVLKAVFIFGQVLWAFYDINHQNYMGVLFDMFSLATLIIGIRMILKDRRSSERDAGIKQ